MIKNKPRRPKIIRALIVFLFISIANYFLARAVFLFYAKYNSLEKTLAILFFLAEVFVMFHAFGYFANVYRRSREKEIKPTIPQLKGYPSVAILIPARHEPKSVLENTLLSCYNINYLNKTIYILDDSSEERYKKEAEVLAKKYNTKLFRREQRHGAKAGIINDCLKNLTEKYVAIFDVDQNPISDFLYKLIPFLEADPRLAFVQTPQFYSNMESSEISFASNMQQVVFYEYVCEGKSTNQAMICCGTNVILRRDALMDVNGLDESSVTEDFATSIRLHIKGWRSVYYNHVNTFGMGPEDLGSYFKQQNRWAMGNVGVFRKIIVRFLSSPFALRPIQWFEYAITGSYYFIGWAYLFLVLCPIVYIFFDIPSFFMNPIVYTLTFIPYFILSIAIFYTAMAAKYYGLKQLFKGQLLSFITLPVYMRASLLGFAGVKGKFQVTAKSGTKRISYLKLWPQIAFWALSLAGITWGINRFIYEKTAAIMINLIWITYHFAMFSSIFYFNEDIEGRRKRLLKKVRFEYKIIEGPYEAEGLYEIKLRSYFSVYINEQLKEGTHIMCKVIPPDKDIIIFDGTVAYSSQKTRKGFETIIGVLKIPEQDKDRLTELIK